MQWTNYSGWLPKTSNAPLHPQDNKTAEFLRDACLDALLYLNVFIETSKVKLLEESHH